MVPITAPAPLHRVGAGGAPGQPAGPAPLACQARPLASGRRARRPGETDPLQIALREAREETGLSDLVPWPDASLQHAVVCYVRASDREPEHEHADLRYFLATEHPDAIVAENEQSPLRWLTIAEARALVGDNNLSQTLDRAERLFDKHLG